MNITILENLTNDTLLQLGFETDTIKLLINNDQLYININSDFVDKLFSISSTDIIKVFSVNKDKLKKIKIMVNTISTNEFFISVSDLMFYSIVFSKKFKQNANSYLKTEIKHSSSIINSSILNNLIQATVVKIINQVIWVKINSYFDDKYELHTLDESIFGIILSKEQEGREFFVKDEILLFASKLDYIDDDNLKLKPVVICERSSEKFLYNLVRYFLGSGISVIRISRIPNHQTKILVSSNLLNNDEDIIKTIKKNKALALLKLKEELGEKIHLIPFDNDIKQLIRNCFYPVEVEISENKYGDIVVVCSEENIRSLIGRAGSNIKSIITLIQKNIKLTSKLQT